MSTNRSVVPSRLFARKALTQFPDGFVPIYSDLTDKARRVFPWDTELHLALGQRLLQIDQPWPEEGLIVIADTYLRDDGVVELVDYEVHSLPDSPSSDAKTKNRSSSNSVDAAISSSRYGDRGALVSAAGQAGGHIARIYGRSELYWF